MKAQEIITGLIECRKRIMTQKELSSILYKDASVISIFEKNEHKHKILSVIEYASAIGVDIIAYNDSYELSILNDMTKIDRIIHNLKLDYISHVCDVNMRTAQNIKSHKTDYIFDNMIILLSKCGYEFEILKDGKCFEPDKSIIKSIVDLRKSICSSEILSKAMNVSRQTISRFEASDNKKHKLFRTIQYTNSIGCEIIVTNGEHEFSLNHIEGRIDLYRFIYSECCTLKNITIDIDKIYRTIMHKQSIVEDIFFLIKIFGLNVKLKIDHTNPIVNKKFPSCDVITYKYPENVINTYLLIWL